MKLLIDRETRIGIYLLTGASLALLLFGYYAVNLTAIEFSGFKYSEPSHFATEHYPPCGRSKI